MRSVSLSLDDKRKLLEAAKANAMRILGVEKIELPESVKPILSEEPEPRPRSPEPLVRRRQGSEMTGPQVGIKTGDITVDAGELVKTKIPHLNIKN